MKLQAFRGDIFAASLFTAYVLFESVFTGIIPAFDVFTNMCEMLDRVEAKGIEKGVTKGEDMIIALLKKLPPGSEDYNKALNASAEERKELYKKYGIV